ncbi:hypothetical protein ACWDY4_44825 [Streptomyces olivaceoviridis]
MEQFHRTAQPSETWQLLVDLHNVDATERADAGTWAVTNLLCKDSDVLPLHMVERTIVEDVAVCRLSASGANHVNRFTGLYATLYPGARRPLRSSARATTKTRPSAGGPEMFLLPGCPERLVVPQPMLESLRAVSACPLRGPRTSSPPGSLGQGPRREALPAPQLMTNA